jgi:kynurenine formamidase
MVKGKMSIMIYDLSQPFGTNIPIWPWVGAMQDVKIERVLYWERDAFPGGCKKQSTVITTKMHAATHIDAPAHVISNGTPVDKIPLTSCYGTGVVISIPKKKWEVITPEDLENTEPKIEPGDFVVINTGWHHLWKVDNYAYMNHSPGLYKEAAEWLVERKVKGVAVDHPGLDLSLAHTPLDKGMPWLDREYKEETGRDPAIEFPIYEPAHMILLGNGVVGIESAGGDMDQVTGQRVTIAAFPIRYEEGDASMVRLVAIIEK